MNTRKRVLVVDDSRSLRRMIEEALVTAGFDVSPCASGDEAVQIARSQPVDVVVTDLNMPGINGLELAKHLRSEPKTAKCPILILTTENSAQRKQEARVAGASGWVLKPFQAATLVQAINQVCKRAGVTA